MLRTNYMLKECIFRRGYQIILLIMTDMYSLLIGVMYVGGKVLFVVVVVVVVAVVVFVFKVGSG